MNTLRLRLRVTAHRITIEAAGPLTALTAHLLSKAVVDALRRYLAPALEIDLKGITDMEYVGEIALQDCAYEAARRGVLFTITKPLPPNSQLPESGDRRNSARRRGPRVRTLTHAGAVCRYRIISR